MSGNSQWCKLKSLNLLEGWRPQLEGIGIYWVQAIDGHGFRTIWWLRALGPATVEKGVQQLDMGNDRVEKDGEDAMKQIEGGAPHDRHSIQRQLKENSSRLLAHL